MKAYLDQQTLVARAMAGVDPASSAPVYYYTQDAVRVGNNLVVPEATLVSMAPQNADAPPLVLAKLAKPEGAALPVVVEAACLSAATWAQRRSSLAIAYNGADRTYTIVLKRLPVTIPILEALPPRPMPPTMPRASVSASSLACTHTYQLQFMPTWDAMGSFLGLAKSEGREHFDAVFGFCPDADYVCMLLEFAECQARLVQGGMGLYDAAQANMAFMTRHYYNGILSDRKRWERQANLFMLGVLSHAFDSSSSGGPTPDSVKHIPRSLQDTLSDRAVYPLIRFWLRANEAIMRHRLSCPGGGGGGGDARGAAHCNACAEAVLEQLQSAIDVQMEMPLADGMPSWLRALLDYDVGSQRQVAATPMVLSDGKTYYKVARALGYRIPSEFETREDPLTGAIIVSREVLLYTVVPMLSAWLSLDALWYMSRNTDPELLAEARRDSADLRKALLATFGASEPTHASALAACREGLSSPDLKKRRAQAPFPPSCHMEGGLAGLGGSGGVDHASSEDVHKWFEQLAAQRPRVVDRVPDIEDLWRRDLMPPCMRNAVARARGDGTGGSSGHLDYQERLTLGSWLALMGFSADDAVRLVTAGRGNGAGKWVSDYRSTHNLRAKKRGERDMALMCRSNINTASNNACACPMREELTEQLALPPAGTKITESISLSKIRWACTRRMEGYDADRAWPPFAVAHPIDYVTLRLDAEAAATASTAAATASTAATTTTTITPPATAAAPPQDDEGVDFDD